MHGNEMHNYQLLLLGQAIISELGARVYYNLFRLNNLKYIELELNIGMSY
jgi:hypothetical protein